MQILGGRGPDRRSPSDGPDTDRIGRPAGPDIVMLSGVRQGVPVMWHEAVAVVSGLAAWVGEAGPDAGVPDLDHIGFSRAGEVFVFPAGKADRDPVRALASLLLAIIGDSPAPTPLIELATPRASGAVRESLDDFQSALGHFQRPNPADDVRTLAARIEGHLLNFESNKELAALKQRVQQERVGPRQEAPETDGRRSRARGLAWLGRAATAVVLAALVGGAYYYQSEISALLDRWQTGDAAVVAAPEAAPPPIESASAERPAPPSFEAPVATTGTSGRGTPANGPYMVGPGAQPTTAPPAEMPADVQPTFVPEDVTPPAPVTPDEAGKPQPADPTVYTEADRGVQPPSLAQPRLPVVAPRGTSDDRTGVVELLVDERGLVERVRLLSPTYNLKESMMLSAVKAWVFSPATKDGRPVKYLTRVRVAL